MDTKPKRKYRKNKTVQILKVFEENSSEYLNKEFGGLKNWSFFGDMKKGGLIIVITAEEK